jgi:hypothetical protein
VIRVSVEVDNGLARLRMLVRAESIRGALGAVEERYPDAVAKVLFPISPEAFFVSDADTERLVEPEAPEERRQGIIRTSSPERQVHRE